MQDHDDGAAMPRRIHRDTPRVQPTSADIEQQARDYKFLCGPVTVRKVHENEDAA